jgi:ferritin-like metal-binding protein YciE
MARAANSDELRQAFQTHREETQGQIERLEQVFEIFGKRAQTKPCEAMLGLIAEGQEIMDEFKDSQALDAGLISAQQAVEHYEIARYGTLRTWAQQLGLGEAAQLLEQTLEEEKRTDELLTRMAESQANPEAEGEGENEDEGEELEIEEEQEEQKAPKRSSKKR